MISLVRCVCVLVQVVLLARVGESQAPSITAAPPNPQRVVEGESVTLQWTYSGAFSRIDFTRVVNQVVVPVAVLTTSTTFVSPDYVSRLTANATGTNATITFSNISRADSDSYSFKVENSQFQSDTEGVQIIVQYPPSFTGPLPSDQVLVEDGSDVTLSCTADGVPTPNINWTKVFNNGSDSNVLFTGPDPYVFPKNRNNAGTYRCTADNGIGNINHTVNVTINFKPENVQFTVNSSNAHICKGEVVDFTCSAVGDPVVHTYQLFVNDTLVNTSSSSVVWSRTLSTGGVFIYKCVANNTVGTANATRTVTVNVISAIQELDNFTVIEGENKTLTCNISGLPVPSVSWTAVTTGSRSPGNVRELTNIRRNDAGEYKCEASNVCGNDSKSLFLNVHFQAEIVRFDANETTVCQNDVVALNCSANGNPMVHSYQLFENNVLVTNGSGPIVWSKTMLARGVFVYRCVATNTIGTASKTVNVTVNVPSSIQPVQNEVITEGGNVTLFCNASGMPSPSVSWIKVSSGQRFSSTNDLVLSNISRNEAGDYRCEANNPCANVSVSVAVDVQYKPEMVRLLTSETTVCRGTNITFNCSADGNPSVFTYQLYMNDVPVNEGSNSGVWNRPMSTGGVLDYKCVVNNTIGTATSPSANITVNVPSSIQPIADEAIIEGGSVTLSCSASGMPSPSVSWIKVSSGERTNGTELEFTNISRSEAGEYRCEASNLCGNATESARVDVLYKPENVQLLTSETKVCSGTNIVFNCSADGNPSVFTYQLYENEVEVNDSSSSGVWNRPMSTGGVFNYRCMVNNTIGTATSTNVTITVNVSSSIQPIADEAIIEGGSVNLSCSASGIPSPSVWWVKVSSGQRTDGTELVLTNINRSEAGEYRCEASNLCANATESATVDVLYKPESVQLLTNNTTVCSGANIVFNCSADSNPQVHTYQLFENNVQVNADSSSGMWNRPMSAEGQFVYKCVVNNTIGTATSGNVTITVNVPSSIQPIQNETLTEGGNVTLFCNASGIPSPFVSWIKVGSNQRTNETELVLTNISRSQAGQYRCEASNLCFSASESAFIDVQYKPGNVQLAVSERTVCSGTVISFTCSADSNPAVDTYQWYENNMLVSGGSSGSWNRPMPTGGVFNYTCMVNNTIGTATSTTVSVTVNVPSSIQPIQNKTLTEGGNVTLSCNASGMPSPSVSWIKVSSGHRTNGPELEFTNINRSEAGEYRCEASNLCGNDSESVPVDVQYGPEITHISSTQTVNNGDTLNLNCTADGNPAPTITWTRLSDDSSVNFPLDVSGRQDEGAYKCAANNSIGHVHKDTSVIVHFPASIVPLENRTVNKSDSVTLFCNVSGLPAPTVVWTRVSTGDKWNNATWIISNIDVSKLGDYRCDANNTYGIASDTMNIWFPGGLCEVKCSKGKTCREFGKFVCTCPPGKKGSDCEGTETAQETHVAGVEFPDEAFKPEYENLANPETIAFTDRVVQACLTEFNGTSLSKVRVTKLSKGSVIADLELTFNTPVYENDVDDLLKEATRDDSLGDIPVNQVVVGRTINILFTSAPPPATEETCNSFFEGKDCKKAKPALIILCVIAGVVVLALLVAIIAYGMHKNKRGQGAIQNGTFGQRQDPEGNGTRDDRNDGRIPRANYVNSAYENDAQQATPMVTFSSNSVKTPGITLNDSSVTQQT